MDRELILKLLNEVKDGKTSPEEALYQLQILPYEDLGFARLDHHRSLRQGFPEVILGMGKSPQQVLKLVQVLNEGYANILVTRCPKETFEFVHHELKESEYNELARVMYIHKDFQIYGEGTILVITAGTADIPVAEEATITAQLMGNEVEKIYDAGVAGIHRLFAEKERIFKANVLIVVAGMEGALPSVVGGLVSRPVIAVPTSIGYGASFNGITPLLAMLNSCASNVAVVNIDNGFGAGFIASLINRKKRF